MNDLATGAAVAATGWLLGIVTAVSTAILMRRAEARIIESIKAQLQQQAYFEEMLEEAYGDGEDSDPEVFI